MGARKLCFPALVFVVLLGICRCQDAEGPCNCFDSKFFGTGNLTAGFLENITEIAEAGKCCESCVNMTDCKVWTWEEASKVCTLLKQYDYSYSSTGHKGSKLRGKTCVDENKHCAHNNRKICETPKAYQGGKTTTRKGVRCQKWTATEPHDPLAFLKDEDRIKEWDTGDHDKCRVAGWDSPWCFTTDEDKRWDYCFDDCHTGTEPDTQKDEDKGGAALTGIFMTVAISLFLVLHI